MSPSGDARAKPPNLVLISLDTTRADALSCYGSVPGLLHERGVVTPHLDAFAEEGLRFERFYANAPSTLSSHATMFTGLDPHQHAIPRNGFPLPSGIPTIAERLSQEGYDTIAVIAALALEQAMGLDRGFRIYDDRMSVVLGPMAQDRAEGVLARTEEALAGRRRDAPLFLFVHFFDPHQPYQPPPDWFDRYADPAYAGPWRKPGRKLGALRRAVEEGTADPADVDQVAGLYLAEVAYMDHHVGLLLELLRDEGVLDRAIVAIVGDHGEVLAEVPNFAYTHGNDVTIGSTRVPLLVRGYGLPMARRGVVARQAGMSSLAPTLEILLGLKPRLGTAPDLFDLVRPGPVRDADGWPEFPTHTVFMEATRPGNDNGTEWNNLPLRRGVRAGGWTFAKAPSSRRPGRLESGPDRAPNPEDEALTPILAEMLERWDAGAPGARTVEMSAETRGALQTLGYLDDPVENPDGDSE